MPVFRNLLAWGSLPDARPSFTLLCEWKRCGSQLHIKEFYLVTIVDAGFILSWSYLNPQAYPFACCYIYYSFYFHCLIIWSFWYGLHQGPEFRSSVASFNDRPFDQLSFSDRHNEQWENPHTAIVAVLHSVGVRPGKSHRALVCGGSVGSYWACQFSGKHFAVPFLLRKLALISGRRGQSEGLHR